MKTSLIAAWRDNKFFLIFLFCMFAFRSALADWNTVPTGSMKPTILEGDRIGVNKLAYDFHIPFTHISLAKLGEPARGDIVVFDSKVSDKRLVKRVIGLPGDVIAMSNNQLIINNQPVTYSDTNLANDRTEHLMGVDHCVRISTPDNHRFANFSAVIVPPDHYLVLGDNRDNSADSRVIGFVPRDEIIGRARNVIMSLNYDNFYLPRIDRFFQTL